MNKKVIIIGAGGNGKVIADIVLKSHDILLGFLDDNSHNISTFIGYPVLGTINQYDEYVDAYFIISIGNSKIREMIATKLKNIKWYIAIHPRAVLSSIDVSIGEGTVIMANSIVNSSAQIGKHCIVNSGAIIEHDNLIDDYVHISVGAKLAGAVHIGKHTWVGIGATISNHIEVCDDCMIGAGALVIKNVSSPGIYVGVPIKKLKD